MREQLKVCLSIVMIVLAGFVIISVFGTPLTNSYPLIPSFVPIFGIKFGIVFLIFLLGYCYYFNIKKGFWWIMGIWIGCTPFYFIAFSFKLHPLALCGFARIVTGNSCLIALAIGVGVLRGKL
ncbi:hypothetical protein J7K55_07030 [Candidatus Aerophobetes bacterium]|nr:hypothetical protein [Candidatus Aerophobetes bacterium]